MPKLIIKREITHRLTRQAILFWVLSLLPVALLAGFLTGNLITQLNKPPFKAGQAPVVPLAPSMQANEFPKNQTPHLAAIPELPKVNLPEKQLTPTPSEQISPVKEQAKSINKAASVDKNRVPTKKTTEKSNNSNLSNQASSVNKTNTNAKRSIASDQQNNRRRPTISPSPPHKTVKSPQIFSESPRAAARPMFSSKKATSSSPPAKPQAVKQQASGTHNDYRLLEQSLGIPLQ